MSQAPSFPPRKGDIICMFLMRAHGVSKSKDIAQRSITDSKKAHRTLIVRKLKGLEKIVPYTAVHWHMGDKGKSLSTQSGTH